MDGLLAWAADVVVGSSSDPESPAAAGGGGAAGARSFLRFTPEQLIEIEKLDGRASELQRGLQQLRQRLPAASLAARLPHLHAESLASQSALALELHAHSASRIQAQMRESTLQSDIAAYAKALAATEQQVVDRSREEQELESSFQEIQQLEQKLKEDCDGLERDAIAKRERVEEDEGFEELALEQEEESIELQSLQSELAKWQTKTAELRKELSVVENETLAWPSSAQREKDLERRLRSLTEQLAAKQAQAERLIIERDNLEARVEQASQARRGQQQQQQHLAESFALHAVKRNKIGVKHPFVENQTQSSKFTSRTVESGGGGGGGFGLLRRSLAFKALVVGYVFLLHVIVLVVLSSKRID